MTREKIPYREIGHNMLKLTGVSLINLTYTAMKKTL